jgi:geranylgeranyl pyrophosphate synthase
VNQSLLVATLCLTQAHHALSRLQDHVDGATYRRVHKAFTAFPITMIEGEELNIAVKRAGIVPPTQLLQVLTHHAADIAACTEVGAVIGGAPAASVAACREFGHIFGRLLLLNDDNRDALNFSLNLDAKLLTQAYPYPVLWAANHSAPFRSFLETVQGRSTLTSEEVATCVRALETTGAVAHVKALMTQYAQEAASTLTGLPETEARDHLVELALAQPSLVLP